MRHFYIFLCAFCVNIARARVRASITTQKQTATVLLYTHIDMSLLRMRIAEYFRSRVRFCSTFTHQCFSLCVYVCVCEHTRDVLLLPCSEEYSCCTHTLRYHYGWNKWWILLFSRAVLQHIHTSVLLSLCVCLCTHTRDVLLLLHSGYMLCTHWNIIMDETHVMDNAVFARGSAAHACISASLSVCVCEHTQVIFVVAIFRRIFMLYAYTRIEISLWLKHNCRILLFLHAVLQHIHHQCFVHSLSLCVYKHTWCFGIAMFRWMYMLDALKHHQCMNQLSNRAVVQHTLTYQCSPLCVCERVMVCCCHI